jgi:5-(carboxyamino)imidazole ribonucleotide mutase
MSAKAPKKKTKSIQTKHTPLVGIIMGSQNDWPIMQHASKILDELNIAHEVRIVSAHRTPDLMFEYATSAEERGLKVIIAGAGGAAHLPGMTAAKTTLPVLGVPIPATAMAGIDALCSIVQMPKSVPVATFAIGESGAYNAAIFAAKILALHDDALSQSLKNRTHAEQAKVLKQGDPR